MACQYRSQVWVTGWCEVACRYCAPDYESTCKYNETDTDWDYDDDWDEYPEEDYRRDRCYECRGYGDDYYIDEQGDLVSACDRCSFNDREYEDDDD